MSLTLCGLLICSKDPGYIRMNIHDPENMKDDVSYFGIKSSSVIQTFMLWLLTLVIIACLFIARLNLVFLVSGSLVLCRSLY